MCQQHERTFYNSVKSGHIVSIQMSKYARGNLESWDQLLGVSCEQKQILLHTVYSRWKHLLIPTSIECRLSLYIETRVCAENRHFSWTLLSTVTALPLFDLLLLQHSQAAAPHQGAESHWPLPRVLVSLHQDKADKKLKCTQPQSLKRQQEVMSC